MASGDFFLHHKKRLLFLKHMFLVMFKKLPQFFCCYLCLAHHQMLLNADFLQKLFFEHYQTMLHAPAQSRKGFIYGHSKIIIYEHLWLIDGHF